MKGGYTLKEGTLVCLVLHRVAVEEQCAHASLARTVVPCNNEGCHSCLEPDTRCIFISVKAYARTSMSRTRQQLTDAACQSIIPLVCLEPDTTFFLFLSKPLPRPPCLDPDSISVMRPVTAEFLLFASGTRHSFFITVKACAWTSMSGTRQHFTAAACQSRIPPVVSANTLVCSAGDCKKSLVSDCRLGASDGG